MAEVIQMPKMSDTMTEGVIISWLKKVGDNVKSGDILAEVETDKATMELESYDDGVILYIGAKENDRVPVGSILAIIGKKGEDYKELLEDKSPSDINIPPNTQSSESTSLPPKETTIQESPISMDQTNENNTPPKILVDISDKNLINTQQDRLKISPLARKIANDMNYDLSSFKGSGPNGRIIRRDIDSYSPKVESIQKSNEMKISSGINEEMYEDIKISSMRSTIAKKLVKSLNEAPHFYLTTEILMDKAMDMRKIINNHLGSYGKVSFNDIIVKAVSSAIREYPEVNGSWMEQKIRYNKHINIGIAVTIDNGLVVPTIRYTDTKSLKDLSAEIINIVDRAKNNSLSVEDMTGSTFTVSNLGMFGIESFTSIINPPSSCILAIGGIRKIPVCNENGEVVPGNVMKLTLSCDHRVVDGAVGAQFMNILKKYLEHPISILL